ncbi:HAMP domain-containing protein [Paraglaciecola aquimarina]|uniref:HAMP domain-containing protein n=1 Tax=Paraglaciecola aquimarina TaxID=1235557 RepID=A0ABU3T0P1_9ALTE|nr:HAMP domain-containing protein [Paraglaciecola aquimarina]MDU0355826.1 HAMP domain-containing protein [Paraglaciecola aquimarina]
MSPVAKDFSTKKLIALAMDDPSSLRSAMDNYQQNRWNTDIYWVLSTDSEVLVSSDDAGNINVGFASILANEGVHWFQHKGEFYLMQAKPVRFVELSGKINAWIVSGVKAESLFNDRLVELTNMHVGIFDFENRLTIGSTFVDYEFLPTSAHNEIGKQSVAGVTYLYTSSKLGDWLQAPVHLVLAKNEADAYLSNQTLRNELFLVLALAAVFAWVAAIIISRGITRPLEQLSRVAKNISKGQYTDQFPSSNAKEVETLSKAISDMQDGIFQREKSINQLAFLMS